MHKIRLLCGSIAVTIATHKNSKIQRLSEFFLMRIGACFATLAILSYTKIIDNNWYLRHLFSYFLLGIQWGESTSPITFPIAFNVLYAYEMLHNSSLRHKTIPMPGANDGARLFFDLWNTQTNDYDAAGEAIYIAVGK